MALFKKGFSLVELVVVLAVIGLIAAIAVPTFSTVRTNAAQKAAEASAESLAGNALVLAVQADTGNGIIDEGEWLTGLGVALGESGAAGPATNPFTYVHPNGKSATITFSEATQSYTVVGTVGGGGAMAGGGESAGPSGDLSLLISFSSVTATTAFATIDESLEYDGFTEFNCTIDGDNANGSFWLENSSGGTGVYEIDAGEIPFGTHSCVYFQDTSFPLQNDGSFANNGDPVFFTLVRE
jgi:prepilin-type N-terminal cleavage/methylation domain-containing protein